MEKTLLELISVERLINYDDAYLHYYNGSKAVSALSRAGTPLLPPQPRQHDGENSY